jgi:urea transport system permease protein
VPAKILAALRTFIVAFVLIALAAPAFAATFAESVGKLATDDFSDTEDAVGEIAASGNPLAYPIIKALQDERLMFDADSKKVYIKQADGKAIDAATGAPVDAIPDSASAVNLNNRLRRAVDAAVGGLTRHAT